MSAFFGMTELQKRNFSGASGADRDPALPVSELGTPHPTCRWQKASDNALVMVWSLTEENRGAPRVVSGNLSSRRSNCVSNNGLVKKAQPINRARSPAERAAIVLLLGVSAFLTVMSFIFEHNDLL